jgi:hypothetical protein
VGQLCVALGGCVTVMQRYVMDGCLGGWWVLFLGRQPYRFTACCTPPNAFAAYGYLELPALTLLVTVP